MSTVWMASIISIAGISIVAMLAWRRSQRLDWQITVLSKRLSRMVRSRWRKEVKGEEVLKKIYALITKAVVSQDPAAVYKIVDILKLALGEGILRPDEPMRLMSITVAALQAKQADSAVIILEAFRPMLRKTAVDDMKMAAEQLALISAVALRERQPFVVAKVSEDLFEILERTDSGTHLPVVLAALRSVRIMGVLVLRRKETALFREINVRFIKWAVDAGQVAPVADEVVLMFTVWLYRIVKTNNLSMFNILLEFIWRMLDANCFKEGSMILLLKEWRNVAGMAALNPFSPLAAYIIEHMVSMAVKQQQAAIWLSALNEVSHVIKLSIAQHGIKTAFPLLYYLLETGRKMFMAELKFGEYSDGFRKQSLLQTLKEIIALLTFASRQDVSTNTGDIIVEIYRYWLDYPQINATVFVNEKSVKKFCQLLLLYWLRTKRHPKRNMPADESLIQPMLISEKERRQLGFVEISVEM